MKFPGNPALLIMSLTARPNTSISSFREAAWTNLILYDGVCNFCSSCVENVRKLDRSKKFTLAPLQSPEGQSVVKELGKNCIDLSTAIYVRRTVKNGVPSSTLTVFEKSDAAIHVLEDLLGIPSMLVSLICTVIPRSLRDACYDLVARNRYRIMGKKEDCGCSPKLPPEQG